MESIVGLLTAIWNDGTYVAAFGLDLVDLFFKARQEPLPALGQSLFIFLE